MTRLTLTPNLTIPALALIALTGCTTPAVDRETAGFNAEKFSQDLEFCRGGTATAFALKTVGGTLYGSASRLLRWAARHQRADGDRRLGYGVS